MAYTVAIVVAPNFGESLIPLAARLHVWICDSALNRAAAEAYWCTHPESSLEHGVTTFKVDSKDMPEDVLLHIIGGIDLHHGAYFYAPPWETLEIYGASLTPAVRLALAKFGVPDVQIFPNGFRCSRATIRP